MLFSGRRLRSSTANLGTTILDFGGLASSRIVSLRDGNIMSVGNFPEILSQGILVGIFSVVVVVVVAAAAAAGVVVVVVVRRLGAGRARCGGEAERPKDRLPLTRFSGAIEYVIMLVHYVYELCVDYSIIIMFVSVELCLHLLCLVHLTCLRDKQLPSRIGVARCPI